MTEQNLSEKKTDEIYYIALQNALTSYDQKLWQIPSLFFAAVGLIITNIKPRESSSLQNGLILLIGSLFLQILVLLYTKAHIFHVSIQKKVNEFDNQFKEDSKNAGNPERIPLTSMTNKELEDRMYELEGEYLKNKKGNEGAKFSCIQKFLAKRRVSRCIRTTMLLVFLASFLSSLYYFAYYFRLIHW